MVQESKVPIRGDVKAACEMLGIDPMEIGNKGKDAQIIGEATEDFSEVVLETVVGGKRIMAPPIGDPIPRIC